MIRIKTNDSDLRQMLLRYLNERKNIGDLILNELGICQSDTIADVVLISEQLHCYEIKSDRDTLSRLERQMYNYNKVFDTVTLVVSPLHLEEALTIIPDWWGVIVADFSQFEVIREPQQNQFQSTLAIAQLLWKEESLDYLKKDGLQKGLSGKARRFIWERIAQHKTKEEVLTHVIEVLRTRKNWRKK